MTGRLHPYARPAYAAALSTNGLQPITVTPWNRTVLARAIPEGGMDAIGAYPMTVLPEDADFAAGFDVLAASRLTSLVMLVDPLSSQPAAAAFDLMRPFKTHQLVRPATYAPSRHHRAEIRRSQARCTVEQVSLETELDTWTGLYAGLVERRAITGVSTFTYAYFRHLAAVPELVALAARAQGDIVAMGLWFAHNGIAYNHLGASSAAGYAVGASYALYDAAITHFAECRAINLGAGAGASDDPDDGLARFKRGFSNDQAQACLYGKVLDPARYAVLSKGVGGVYFPAYRNPEAGAHSRRTASASRSISAAA